MSQPGGGGYKKQSMLPQRDLDRLVAEPDSAIYKVREEVHVALHPKYLNDLPLGLLHYFNKQINTWHPELRGILAGYGKLQLKRPHGDIINEEAFVHLDVISNFWVFRPEKGTTLKGTVTKKSASHISCLVHGIFNVPCHKSPGEDRSWAANIRVNSHVRLEVVHADMSQKVPHILGKLLGTESPVKRGTAGLVEIVDPSKWGEKLQAPLQKSKAKKVGNVAGLPTAPAPMPNLANPGPVNLPLNPLPISAIESVASKVRETVLPPAINVDNLLGNLAPVKELQPKKKKKKVALPENIAEVVSNVVNLPSMPAPKEGTPVTPKRKGEKETVSNPMTTAPIAQLTSTPLVTEDQFEVVRKKKKKRKLQDETPLVPEIFSQIEATPEPSKKKKKKKKNKEREDGEDGEETAIVEEDSINASSSGKKKKKKKHRHEEESMKDSLIASMLKKQRH